MGNVTEAVGESTDTSQSLVKFQFVLLADRRWQVAANFLQIHLEQGQAVAKIVVQVSCDPFALLFLRGKKAGSNSVQFFLGSHQKMIGGLYALLTRSSQAALLQRDFDGGMQFLLRKWLNQVAVRLRECGAAHGFGIAVSSKKDRRCFPLFASNRGYCDAVDLSLQSHIGQQKIRF